VHSHLGRWVGLLEIKELNQYRYVVKETVIEDVINETLTPNRIIMIGVKDSTNGIVIPHPIPSDFIRLKYEYQGNSFNTQKSAAEVICRFLNFIHNKITNKDEEFLSFSYYGISGLTLQHGSRFITSLTLQGRNKQTVAIYEQYLIQFYVFLQEQKLIDMQFDFSLFSRSKGYRNRPDSPFRHPSLETRYPSRFTSKKQKQKAKDFRGKDRKMLVTEFIQCSKEIAPEITLGICLQIFGGIRRGEIVNLTRGSFNVVKGKSMIVKIEDNRNILFGHLKNTEKEFPKRLNYLETHMALQTILDNDLLWEVYDLHFEKLNKKIQQGEVKNPIAVLVDNHGNPMSGKTYEKKFSKVKKHFLNRLHTGGRYYDYIDLSERYWGSHICRGIFTNFLMDMGLSVTQIAIARGDRSITAAMEYVDERVTMENLQQAIEELSKWPFEKRGIIEQDIIRTNWKGGVLKGAKVFR
jgi:integrase